MFPYGQSATVIRSGKRNRDGDRQPESRHTLPSVAFSPATTVVGVDGVDQEGRQSSAARMYAPYGADIRAGDRVIINSVEYRVVGAPASRRFVFSGRGAGVTVQLEEVAASGSTL